MTYNHTQTCEIHHAHSGKIKQWMHNVKIADTLVEVLEYHTQLRHFNTCSTRVNMRSTLDVELYQYHIL